LAARGFSLALRDVLRPDVQSRRNQSLEDARKWLEGTLAYALAQLHPEELVAAERQATETGTPEAMARYFALLDRRNEAQAGSDDEVGAAHQKRS
jgi:hypothetical protein